MAVIFKLQKRPSFSRQPCSFEMCSREATLARY